MSFINPFIFREYDVRGNVEEDFPEHVVIKLGKAFGTYVKRAGGKEIAISGDIRVSTPELINFFKRGALSTGVDIINLGILPTPVNYFSMFQLDLSASVQVTGSHNPPEFNGFKMSLNKKLKAGTIIINFPESDNRLQARSNSSISFLICSITSMYKIELNFSFTEFISEFKILIF